MKDVPFAVTGHIFIDSGHKIPPPRINVWLEIGANTSMVWINTQNGSGMGMLQIHQNVPCILILTVDLWTKNNKCNYHYKKHN